MSLVGRFDENLGAERGLGMDHADCGGFLRHDDAGDNDALQIVFPAMQRAMVGGVGKPPARAEVFDAREARDENILHCNRLGQRSRQKNRHSAPPVLIPAEAPARGSVWRADYSANEFVAASRQVRDHAGAMA